jgi:hypothetical protein
MSTKNFFFRKWTAAISFLILIILASATLVYFSMEINSLQSKLAVSSLEIENLNAAKLVLSDPDNPVGGVKYGSPLLGWTNENPNLYVYGVIFNVGTQPAYDSRIHVVANSANGTILLDDYIDLGTIDGGFVAKINTQIKSNYPLIGDFNVIFTPEWK